MSDNLDALFNIQPERVWGRFTNLRMEDSDWGRTIILEVLPIGEQTPRFIFFRMRADKAPDRRSKWARFLAKLQKAGLSATGWNDLQGRYARFRITDHTSTIDGEEVNWEEWVPEAVFLTEAEAVMDMQATGANITVVPAATTDTAPTPAAPKAPAIDPQVLAVAKSTWAAIGSNEDAFRTIAAASWPEVDVEALLAAVKGA